MTFAAGDEIQLIKAPPPVLTVVEVFPAGRLKVRSAKGATRIIEDSSRYRKVNRPG